MTTNSQQRVKILMLGESGVGKSSILVRFTDDKFSPSFSTTLGVEYKQKIIQYESQSIQVQVWDTAGQERFRTLTPVYYKNVDGVMLVYDIQDEKSFESLNYWLKNLQDNADPNISTTIVGNKADMNEKRKITKEQGQKLSDDLKIPFIEGSAKSSQNINIAFINLVEQILKKRQSGQGIECKDTHKLGNTQNINNQDKKCC